MKIDKKIWIEDLLKNFPQAQQFLSKKGIVCIMCGEPVWGTLEEQMEEKGFSKNKMDTLITELNEFIKNNS
ncbi:MAG: DUF1858 domain-containing protein [bacterium]